MSKTQEDLEAVTREACMLTILLRLTEQAMLQGRYMNTNQDISRVRFEDELTGEAIEVVPLAELPVAERVNRFAFEAKTDSRGVWYEVSYFVEPNVVHTRSGQPLPHIPLKNIAKAYH